MEMTILGSVIALFLVLGWVLLSITILKLVLNST